VIKPEYAVRKGYFLGTRSVHLYASFCSSDLVMVGLFKCPYCSHCVYAVKPEICAINDEQNKNASIDMKIISLRHELHNFQCFINNIDTMQFYPPLLYDCIN
jgi:hypothetical protein